MVNNRIIEIVSFIVRNIFESKDVVRTELKIVEKLLEKGYELEEIDSAFDWISNVLKFGFKKERHKRSLRPFTTIENFKLTEGAKSLIYQLYRYNYLTMEEFELVMIAVETYPQSVIDEKVLGRIITLVLKSGKEGKINRLSVLSSEFIDMKET